MRLNTRQQVEQLKRVIGEQRVDAARIIRETPPHNGITQEHVDKARAEGNEAAAEGFERVMRYRDES